MSNPYLKIYVPVAAAMLAFPAMAEELTIGLASEPTAIDPHYHDLSPNNALGLHVYAALAKLDADQNVHPDLATSWEAEDDNTWVFKLREDVTFSDGSEFNADDVIFSFCRVVNNESSITNAFTDDVKNFASVEAPDSHTIRITTENIEPLLPERLSQIMLLSEGIVEHGDLSFDLENDCGVTGEWPSVNDFNNGDAAIGTGPYVLEKFTKGNSITMVRNAHFPDAPPEWDKLTFKPVPSAGPRLAGLLSGDYDLIESPAARDIGQIESEEGLEYTATPSNRVIFLQMDIGRDDSPFIEAEDGSNPFQDERVRRAISMAIDRQIIVDRIMDGFAEPAYQFVPSGLFGALENPEAIPYDPEGAKALLAEAGYPDGFKVTFHATNDRYINDSQVAQTIAQFLTRIGIETELDAMTRSIFFTRRSNREFSFSMGGWGSSEGGAASFLRQYVTTGNEELGVGASNYGGWSDPEFDAVLLEAITTIDDEKRAALLQQAVKLAMSKQGFIPIHFESTIWGYRKGLHYDGRKDQYTLAYEVTSDSGE